MNSNNDNRQSILAGDHTANVLQEATINMLRSDSKLKDQGRKILARWALNQPEGLLILETKEIMTLYTTVINQLEIEALLENMDQALSETEKLQLAEVSMSLPTS
ncbi:hypothetical protein [Yersinia enterocolitica]|uniref:hypothetical protein n=1 Tax=Yersinia enterocolitica TaxID=630 RepID=UPI002AC3ADCA|nr:hypothetical protein [Yersinia enterocolitica]